MSSKEEIQDAVKICELVITDLNDGIEKIRFEKKCHLNKQLRKTEEKFQREIGVKYDERINSLKKAYLEGKKNLKALQANCPDEWHQNVQKILWGENRKCGHWDVIDLGCMACNYLYDFIHQEFSTMCPTCSSAVEIDAQPLEY